jgi:hypothetical protein
MAAKLTTVIIITKMLTIYPIYMERTNCARNTMLLRTETSVPSSRSCVPCETPPPLAASNYKEAGKAQYFIIQGYS